MLLNNVGVQGAEDCPLYTDPNVRKISGDEKYGKNKKNREIKAFSRIL